MYQETLIEEIKKSLNEHDSVNEAIAEALRISYDAAHRRTSLKAKFSLEESILLANYFNLSLDELYGKINERFVSVKRTKQIHNEEDLQQYFDTSYSALLPLLNRVDCEVFYSAKDIPIFYTLENNRLSHFKMYVWLKLLDDDFRNISFSSYVPKISTIQSARKLGELYSDLKTSEIWDITTINSTLKQIHFYYKAGQVDIKEALILCTQLKELLNEISLKVIAKNDEHKIFYNELLLMNNNVLIVTPKEQSLFVPCAMLSYFNTSDIITCLEAKQYFDKQLYHSKLMNTSGEKEQNQFYNKLVQKIDALISLIKASEILDFE